MAALLGGFLTGYFLGVPKTVHDRVAMWLSPWSNTVRGGDQVAHSLWAMASGGALGSGPGLGESDVIPAGYTDLIVSVLGEDWGFLGLLSVYLIYGLLIWLGLRVARRARQRLRVFPGAGIDAAGERGIVADLRRHSGFVPALGRGHAVSELRAHGYAGELRDCRDSAGYRVGRKPGGRAEALAPLLPGCAGWRLRWRCCWLLIVGKAAYVQLGQANEIAGQGTLVLRPMAGRRYVYNPRLIDAARTLQRGTIYDRAGLPLATSSWAELEQHRAQYQDARDRYR